MSDLISRSAVIELLRKNMTNDIQDQIITENNINLICAIPTAYDISKVVEELVDTFGDDICELNGNYECYTDIPCDECKRNRMLDLVRKGGVE